MAKFDVRICAETCKGCELCVLFCPKKIIAISSYINDKGYSPAECIKKDECVGCKSCALVCPDGAISIYKEDATQ
ncbi:MAG: 4Fe-4S dicluster domain-containing protein [Oscillospiraceae bacterium]|nr:4Fe-4S dicluster domain-containing protein [Oscillospiraceae bacterium]